jgi:hypothetical protein
VFSLWRSFRPYEGGYENVNRLVDVLLARRDVVDFAVQRGVASFELLLTTLDESLFSEAEREVIEDDRQLSRRLRAGYLPTITAPDWDGAVSLAGPDTADGAGWWTVMIPATTGVAGLTVPQNQSDIELIALFIGPPDNADTLIYDPTMGSLVDLTLGAHCGAPSRGRCAAGTCGGCRPRKVWDKATGIGITCRCQDQAR